MTIADEDFLRDAPFVYTYDVDLPASPEQVWASLASDRGVGAWSRGLLDVTWTSPRPFAVGTTRTVVLPLRAVTFRERFIHWDDEGHRHVFTVEEANRPWFECFAEDYRVEPHGRGSRFSWTVAFAPTPRIAAGMRRTGALNRAFASWMIPGGARRHFRAAGAHRAVGR